MKDDNIIDLSAYGIDAEKELIRILSTEINQAILNSIFSIGNMDNLPDKNIDGMIKRCRSSFEQNINFRSDVAAKALQNLIILMCRKIKLDHCE